MSVLVVSCFYLSQCGFASDLSGNFCDHLSYDASVGSDKLILEFLSLMNIIVNHLIVRCEILCVFAFDGSYLKDEASVLYWWLF